MKQLLGFLGVIAIVGLLFVSIKCVRDDGQRKSEERKEKTAYEMAHPFEKYVYLDTVGVVHRKRDCVFLYFNAIQYYDTTYDVVNLKAAGYCTECFSTKQYESFQRLRDRARERFEFFHSE